MKKIINTYVNFEVDTWKSKKFINYQNIYQNFKDLNKNG